MSGVVLHLHSAVPLPAVALAWAERYSAAGMPPIAIRPTDKRPLAAGWQTITLKDTRTQLAAAPGANLGIAVPHGYVVLDVDVKDGVDGYATLSAFELEHGPLPPTLRAKTPSGGSHLWFKLSEGTTVPNAVRFAPGLDTRSGGKGLVVAEPSVTAAGAYRWENWSAPVAPAPEWLLQEMQSKKSAAAPSTPGEPLRIPQGQRNHVLFERASTMRAAGLSAAVIYAATAALNRESCLPPLDDAEVRAIAESASRYARGPVPHEVFGRAPLPPGALLAKLGPMDVWPEPTTLPNPLPPVAHFDADLMPAALRNWVVDIAHRMQCSPDFPAAAALVGLSSLIGARAVIQPKARDDWQVVPNLWGACVGRPGVKKSPALNEALKPLHRLQVAEHERWRVAHGAWALDVKVSELAQADRERKAKGLAGKDPAQARALLQADSDGEPEPMQRRFIINDATVEKLGELLVSNPWGTLSYRDELYGLLTGMDKQGQEGARAFYLQSFDGSGGYTFDRIGRGTVHIPRVCLAMIGGIQPGRIHDYVRGAVAGGSADDGLLQRFGLIVWPDFDADYVHVDQWPDTPARQQAWSVFERLAELQPAADDAPAVWRFSSEAQDIFAQWLVPFENELRRDDLHPALVSHLAKYRKLVPALALIFAMIDTPDSGGIVGEQELVRALAWAGYLRSHAERLYAAAVQPETDGARMLLVKIKAGKLTDADGVMLERFTPRQVAQKGWTGLGTVDAVRHAADLLADHDWVRKEVVPSIEAMGRGRPSECYIVNPAALKARS